MLTRCKNVSTGAVIKAKPGTESGVHKLGLPANYQTGFSYKFRPTNGWYAIRFFRAEFMNAPKQSTQA